MPAPTPVAVNTVPGLLSAAPINVKSVVPVVRILYSIPIWKLGPACVAFHANCAGLATSTDFQPTEAGEPIGCSITVGGVGLINSYLGIVPTVKYPDGSLVGVVFGCT